MTKREIHHANVVFRAVLNHPVDAGDDVARQAAAIVAEHTHVDELRARRDTAGVKGRDARSRRPDARDDASDVRAVPVRVRRRRVVRHEADGRDDFLRKRRMRGIDSRVHDGDHNALAINAGHIAETEQARPSPRPDLIGSAGLHGHGHRRCGLRQIT